jgi:hypothetical protein
MINLKNDIFKFKLILDYKIFDFSKYLGLIYNFRLNKKHKIINTNIFQ